MKKQRLSALLVIVVSLLPVAYVALIWSAIPQTVAMHFGPDLRPDRTGPKEELWFPVGMLAGVSILLYFLLTNLHRFDPKRRSTEGRSTFYKLALGLGLFLTALNFLLLTASIKGGAVLSTYLFPLLGLLFLIIGNYMQNIKPNYIAGFRLPWTLSDDDNWRRTHHVAGRLWFGAGLLIIAAGFFVPAKAMLFVSGGILLVAGLLPAFYSYKIFKAKQYHQNPNL